MTSGMTTKALDKVSKAFVSETDWDNTDVLNNFTLMSANLINFLPMLDVKQHRSFFNDFIQRKVQNGLDLILFKEGYPNEIIGRDCFVKQIRSTQGILATYHFGPFQLINYLLVREEIPYILLVSGQVIEDWRINHPELLSYLESVRNEERFFLIDADDPRSLRLLYSLLHKGFNLLIYTDGIVGINEANADKLSHIDFLGQQIFVPRGTAMLSKRFNLPIFPCLFIRQKDYVELQLGESIFPADFNDLSLYTQIVAERLFSFLSKYVMHWPDQWTNWSMLHRFLLRKAPIGNIGEVKDDFERYYGLYVMDNNTYLLEKQTYKLFPMERNDFEILRKYGF